MRSRFTRKAYRPLACGLLISLGIAACGGDAAPTSSEPVPEEETPSADAATVYSVAVDPGDGALLIGAGESLVRLPVEGGKPDPVRPTMSTGGASGEVKDLVLRYTGGKTLVASGHAAAPLPQNLGLLRSADDGETWESVSGLNEADYHEIEVSKGRILALRADRPQIQVSTNSGKSFETREPPADSAPIDVTVNPDKPGEWAVSSEQGVFISTDDGGSWRQRDVTFGPRLVWAKGDALISVGRDGKVRRSADSGRSWDEVGGLPAGPREVTSSPDGELYAVVPGGEVLRSADAGATWSSVGKVS